MPSLSGGQQRGGVLVTAELLEDVQSLGLSSSWNLIKFSTS
jgi:hypothetical protein